MTVIEYPKCTTCKKARAWLDMKGIDYEVRNIAEKNPSEAELRSWHAMSEQPLKRLFNTSGLLYKSMSLKDKIADMSEDEQFALLATNGMLVRRPILVNEKGAFFGFDEKAWGDLTEK